MPPSTKRILFTLCGLTLILVGLAFSLLPEYTPSLVVVDVQKGERTAKITDVFQMVTAGPIEFRSIEVQVRYPNRVRKNETAEVVAQITQRYMQTNLDKGSADSPIRGDIDSLIWEISLKLNGAAFDVSPKDHTVSAGTSLPANVYWTALPKGTGDHSLLLDIKGIIPAENRWHKPAFQHKVVVNGKPANGLKSEYKILLPLEVVTKWGVSQLWRDLIAGAIAGFGFLLTVLQFRIKIERRTA